MTPEREPGERSRATSRRKPTKPSLKRAQARMRGSDRRRLIQETAARLIAANGYERTSMEDIAQAVGIKKGSFYYFYRSKDELLADLFRLALEEPQQKFDAIVAGPGVTTEKLRRLVTALVHAFHELLALMVTFTRVDLDSLKDPRQRRVIRDLRRRFETTWEDVVREGIERGEIRPDLDYKIVTFGIIGMINWMFKWYEPGGRLGPDQIAEIYGAMICEGLAPAKATRASPRRA